jgi:hypothetical protein
VLKGSRDSALATVSVVRKIAVIEMNVRMRREYKVQSLLRSVFFVCAGFF